jgi:hypothetical protein
MDVRPHPGLLPQEKENGSPASQKNNDSGDRLNAMNLIKKLRAKS